MLLSILICSTDTRVKTFLPSCYTDIAEQANMFEGVEVLALVDNKKRTVGAKRNDLINIANGAYVAFVDDDDMVEHNYVGLLLAKIKSGVDCIVFDAVRYVNRIADKRVKYGIQYRKDSEDSECYYRIPNHLMCIKRSIALSTPFKNISFGEDAQWAREILYKIQTQEYIPEVLYHYYYSPTTTETQNGGT